MNKKVIYLSLSFLLSCMSVFSQQAYDEGWKALQKNDRAEARKYFNQVTSNPDALLALSLLDMTENKLESAFTNFKKCYELSANPYPYLYAMSSMPYVLTHQGGLKGEKLAFFEKIVTDPAMNGTLKAMVYERLGENYILANNLKKANECFAKMGAIQNWQVLGTFDNISGSGFNKDWGAIEKAKSEDIFKNKVNADVKWYSPGANHENQWFHFEYQFYTKDAVMYAQTFVSSPSEQEVYLRAGNSGSLKIWLNDALVSSVSEERNCDLDIYYYKVKLNKGTNRILVQIGSSDIDQANFLIRLTDAAGNPIPNLTSSDTYASYTKSTESYDTKELPFFAEEFFLNKIETDKNNPINYILLAETYLRNDKTYQGTKILKNLESIAGRSTLTAYRLYEAYMRSQNQTDTEKEMEYIKKEDPNSFYALQARYDEAVEAEKYDEAEELYNKTKELYGSSDITDQWSIDIASYQKNFDKAISLAKDFYTKNPDNYQYMYLNYIIEKNVSKKPAKAIAIVENYLKSNNNSEALSLLAGEYLEQGNAKKGLAALYKRSEDKPYAVGYYQNSMKVLTGMQLYNEALSMSEKALKLAPYLSEIYNARGVIYKNLNNEEQAKENFKKAIYYSPASYDARDQLRLLEKRKEIFSLFKDSNLQELIAKAPGQDKYPDDNSVVILNEKQQVIYPEGAKEYRYELAAKILNKSGIEDWKEYTIGYNGYWQKLIVDKAEVIKANGTVSKAESDDNHIVFTNLETNDVLHLVYRMQDLSSGKLASQFFDDFQFQYGIPIISSKFSLLVPKDKPFKYVIKNTKVQPQIREVEDMQLYSMELTDVPAMKSETYMSSFSDLTPTFFYSSIPDWKYVSDWYKDLTVSKFNADYVLKETYNELLKGKEKVSKLEKAKIFYNYILQNITYSSVDFMQSNYVPQKASRTITTRLGDCKDLSTLFVSLCRMADIDANLVLISTRSNGTDNLVMPTINFNHAIAQLNVDNKTYYLELTDDGLPFGSLPLEDISAQILPIPYNADIANNTLIHLTSPLRTVNQSVRQHTVTVTNNDLSIIRKSIYYGDAASISRGNNKSLSDEERLKKLNESVSKDFIVPAKVSDLKFTEIETLADSVIQSYNVKVSGALQEVAGMKIFSLPWSDINSLDFVSTETRNFPLEYWTYQSEDKTTEIITLILPQGKKFVEIPTNKQLECADAKYSLSFDLKDSNKIVIKRYFERKNDVVSVQNYPTFREFMNSVSESDNKQYAIK